MGSAEELNAIMAGDLNDSVLAYLMIIQHSSDPNHDEIRAAIATVYDLLVALGGIHVE